MKDPENDVVTYRRAAAFPLPTLEEIEAALDELLAATLKHDRERDGAAIAARAGGASESLSAHGFTADALLETEFLPGEAFIADPIGRSLREGVRMLGKAQKRPLSRERTSTRLRPSLLVEMTYPC